MQDNSKQSHTARILAALGDYDTSQLGDLDAQNLLAIILRDTSDARFPAATTVFKKVWPKLPAPLLALYKDDVASRLSVDALTAGYAELDGESQSLFLGRLKLIKSSDAVKDSNVPSPESEAMISALNTQVTSLKKENDTLKIQLAELQKKQDVQRPVAVIPPFQGAETGQPQPSSTSAVSGAETGKPQSIVSPSASQAGPEDATLEEKFFSNGFTYAKLLASLADDITASEIKSLDRLLIAKNSAASIPSDGKARASYSVPLWKSGSTAKHKIIIPKGAFSQSRYAAVTSAQLVSVKSWIEG